LIQNW